MQCLFSIGYSLHRCITCFSLVTVYTHALLAFHWLTSMQCLFFSGHGLHPHNASSPLVTAYTHAFLVSSNGDFIYSRMYQSKISARFSAGQSDILHIDYLNIENPAIKGQVYGSLNKQYK